MKALMDNYKRFVYLTKIYISYYRKYPLGLFLKLVYLPLQMMMYVFLWLAISENASIDMNYIFFYYLYATLLSYAFPFIHISRDIQEDVISGRIVNFLVRPIRYSTPIISKYTAWLICYSIVYIPVIFLSVIFYKISILCLLKFLALVMLGSVIEFLLWYNVGLLSLKTEKIRGVIIAVSAFRQFASGALIPLSFFSSKIQSVLNLLPFRLYIFTPINTLLHNPSNENFYTILLLCFFWLAVLSVFSIFQWNKGMQSIQINGQ